MRSAYRPPPSVRFRQSSRIRTRVISRTRNASPRRRAVCSPSIPGLELREMDESSLCCGSAGIYNVQQPEMAQRLQRRKVERIVAVDPDIVATANPGCALQMRNGLDRADAGDVRVKHVIQLLDESLAAARRSVKASAER